MGKDRSWQPQQARRGRRRAYCAERACRMPARVVVIIAQPFTKAQDCLQPDYISIKKLSQRHRRAPGKAQKCAKDPRTRVSRSRQFIVVKIEHVGCAAEDQRRGGRGILSSERLACCTGLRLVPASDYAPHGVEQRQSCLLPRGLGEGGPGAPISEGYAKRRHGRSLWPEMGRADADRSTARPISSA